MDIYLAGLANLSGTNPQREEDVYYADRGSECRSIVRRALVIAILLALALVACF